VRASAACGSRGRRAATCPGRSGRRTAATAA
jgi:hypothetical protein